MSLEYLEPVSMEVLETIEGLPDHVLGKNIEIFTEKSGLPDISEIKICIVFINETRNSYYKITQFDSNEFRKEFYKLYPGNWNFKIADFGDLPSGKNVEDTYFALSEICSELMQNNITPVIIGGSQDLTISLYESFLKFDKLINIVSVDNRFDFSQGENLISSRSYLNDIITKSPSRLNNFTNLGYQTYLIAQEELDLMDKLFFDAYRLGEVLNDLKITEPVFREADIVSFDMKALNSIADGSFLEGTPNGLDSRAICTMSRYAGISDRLSIVGYFDLPNNSFFLKLFSEVLWYFIEGFQCRFDEYPIELSHGFKKYNVSMSDREMVFYKSIKSGRWWMEIGNKNYIDNKTKSSALLSCTYQDYLDACNDILSDRWWKATKRS
tara:strand:+ start:1385 stop:2533 length:1149 start_codon:yes stop_codon:yes gene_type:complete